MSHEPLFEWHIILPSLDQGRWHRSKDDLVSFRPRRYNLLRFLTGEFLQPVEFPVE